LLIGHFLGVDSPKKVFEILIQLGAVLAILTVYSAKIMRLLVDLPRDPRARTFVAAVVIGFLPAAITGATFHKTIKGLLEYPLIVCVSLILGGIVLLAVDRMKLETRYADAMQITPKLGLLIGVGQCLAMIPGVSRSGATIVTAMLMGVSKRAAAEFSFFLAMPTMAGAFAYDLYKNYKDMDAAAVQAVAIGFVIAFVTGVFVVKYLLDFVSRRGFAPFAWWRILVGGLGLGALAVLG
jgi:undecaprenyl-diphosphatase